MRSPLTAMTVIVCPHCGTRYQVPAETLGPKGREVQCAHCARSWRAAPAPVAAAKPPAAVPAGDPDQLFDGRTERDLDAAFAAEEKALLAGAAGTAATGDAPPQAVEEARPAIALRPRPEPGLDPRLRRRRAKDFARRQSTTSAQLPMARIRRAVRVSMLGALFTLIGAGIALRTDIVRYVPDLAGAYAALGMEVNTVGLEFRDVSTLLALHRGANVMKVQARIYSIAPRTVAVPPVVVTLLDRDGTPLYEWSVTPETGDLEPGEVVDFASQLASPPAAAARVRLTFSGGRKQSETLIAPAIQQPAL